MEVSLLLPAPEQWHVEEISMSGGMIEVRAISRQASSCCPRCAQPSRWVHSRYWRQVLDLPWAGYDVRLRLQVKKFFCLTAPCPRRIFTEQLPDVVAPSARRTLRLEAAWRNLGIELGGRAGMRVAQALRVPTSRMTLLRLVRRTPTPPIDPPKVIGIDDWAFRKGHRYGTIIVDLERRRPIDALPDAKAESVAAWLRARPGIEVISRDRGDAYIEGARQGAPMARQVADRFHLLKNVGEVARRVVDSFWPQLRPALLPPPEPTPSPVLTAPPEPPPYVPPPSRAENDKQARRARRLARYEDMLRLWDEGLTKTQIGARVGLDRDTISRYLRRGTFPEIAPRVRRPTMLDPHLQFLRERWEGGCRNGRQLHREIRERGYQGGYSRLIERVSAWKRAEPGYRPHARRRDAEATPAASLPEIPSPPTARQVAMALGYNDDERQPEDLALIDRLCLACPPLTRACDLIRTFRGMFRRKLPDTLATWLTEAAQSDIPDIQRFAKSIRGDQDAVQAALELPWSQGQVEGQVNRVKMLKRQMYGRAKFDLLRQRILLKSQ